MADKSLRQFIDSFDFSKPDWSNLPQGFPDCDLGHLQSNQVGRFLAISELWQLNRPERPKSKTRVWTNPQGYKYLAVWQNAALLRVLIRLYTKTLPRNEYRLKAQMDDAARSVKRNIEEGWKRPTTKEYLQFIGYSQASLEEIRGDVRDCQVDGFLKSIPGSNLRAKGFNLRVNKGPRPSQIKGEPTEPNHPYYKPLNALNAKTLTYEEFMEIINKTDYLLRQLVESLEKKLGKFNFQLNLPLDKRKTRGYYR